MGWLFGLSWAVPLLVSTGITLLVVTAIWWPKWSWTGPDGLTAMSEGWCWLIAGLSLHVLFHPHGCYSSSFFIQHLGSKKGKWSGPRLLGFSLVTPTISLTLSSICQNKSQGRPRFKECQVDSDSWGERLQSICISILMYHNFHTC